jgi:hypothetical protein
LLNACVNQVNMYTLLTSIDDLGAGLLEEKFPTPL